MILIVHFSFSFSLRQCYTGRDHFMKKEAFPVQKPNISPAVPARSERALTAILLALGMPAHMKGHRYLAEAVRLVLENEDLLDGVTKMLYPAVAQRFGCRPASVERAIRHSIELTWQRGGVERLNELVGSPAVSLRYKPTSSELIALIAQLISLAGYWGNRLP